MFVHSTSQMAHPSSILNKLFPQSRFLVVGKWNRVGESLWIGEKKWNQLIHSFDIVCSLRNWIFGVWWMDGVQFYWELHNCNATALSNCADWVFWHGKEGEEEQSEHLSFAQQSFVAFSLVQIWKWTNSLSIQTKTTLDYDLLKSNWKFQKKTRTKWKQQQTMKRKKRIVTKLKSILR